MIEQSRIWGIIGHLLLNTTTLTRHPPNFRPDENSDRTLRLHSTVQYFRSVRTELWTARRLNKRTPKRTKFQAIQNWSGSCLHPWKKVQGPTSPGKGTGAYIPKKRYRGLHPQEKVQGPTSPKKVQKPNPRKCKGVYIPRKRYRGLRAQKRYGGQVPINVRGPTSPGKVHRGLLP